MIMGGCDPGLDGAFALIEGNRVLMTLPVPTIKGKTKGRQLDEALLDVQFKELCMFGPEHFYVEAVHAMPQQGSVSMFKFGECFGFQKGLIRGGSIPLTFVPPARWKMELGLSANKEASLDRASQLFPQDVKLFREQRGVRTKEQAKGLSEAVLIGLYGQMQLAGASGQEMKAALLARG